MKTLTARQNKTLLYCIILTLTVSLSFTISSVDQRNYLLIGCMSVGFFMTLMSKLRVPKVDGPIISILLLMSIPQILFHWNSIRLSSILYTFMFGFYFMLGARAYIRSGVKDIELSTLLKRIIYSYFFVLVIQQICVLFGLPVFNGIVIVRNEPWKLNSLAPEPSHTAIYLGILMTGFLCLSDIINNKSLSLIESFKLNKRVWIAFLYTMVTMVSGSAFVIILVVLAKYINKRNLIIFSCIFVVFLVLGKSSGMIGLHRASSFVGAVITGNPENMIKADHSASVRVVPTLLCLSHINPFSFNGWFGDGMGTVSTWMSNLFPGVPDDYSGGGIFSLFVEFGLFPGIIILSSSLKWTYIKEIKIPLICLWIVAQVITSINVQLFWCYILLFYILKSRVYLSKHYH